MQHEPGCPNGSCACEDSLEEQMWIGRNENERIIRERDEAVALVRRLGDVSQDFMGFYESVMRDEPDSLDELNPLREALAAIPAAWRQTT